MIKSLCLSVLVACVFGFAAWAAEPAAFELKANDRVVFVGDGVVERDIAYGYLETMLTARYHGKNITFRNAGWSGDTVWGESRAVFGQQKDGYNSLIKIINETKPTVVFLFYGMNESFAGPTGLAHFEEGYNALLDNVLNPAKDAEHAAAPPAQSTNRKDPKDTAKAPPVQQREVPRVVLVSPIMFQTQEAPALARAGKQNENLKLYVDAIQKIARTRGANFADMYSFFDGQHNQFKRAPKVQTSDGMHLTPTGYVMYAQGMEDRLGLKAANWKFEPRSSVYDEVPPKTPAPENAAFEKLRGLIIEKNIQFFNKWRPQNETYLFLFRKQEQGRNAKEIPEFDPFIAAKEADIAKAAEDVAKSIGL